MRRAGESSGRSRRPPERYDRRLLRRLVILAAACAIAVPAIAAARVGANPPLQASALKGYEAEVTHALAAERTAVNDVYKNTYESHTDASSKVVHSRADLYDAKESINNTSFGGDSPVPDLDAAYKADTQVEDLMRNAMGGDNFHKPFPKSVIKKIVAQLTIAIAAKKRALTLMSEITLTAPAAPVGPLEGCVIVVNNGSTSNENIKIFDAGGGGLPGMVNFNGQGLNQNSMFHLDPTGTAVSPFTVGVFGPATVSITVTEANGQTQTLSFGFTLGQGNDVTTTDCTPHQ